MVILFVIAGMSARYSLQKRTERQFIKERTVKLLIPSTLGLFVVHWITGYLNIKIGGALQYIPKFLVYPIAAISGIGPLWFIQMLFLFSCLLVLLRKIDKTDRIWTVCGKMNMLFILLLALPIFLASQILNMPVLTMYRFGIYFVSFLIGYYIFSHDKVQSIIESFRLPLLCLSALLSMVYTRRFGGSDYTLPSCLQSILCSVYLWSVVLTVFGCGKRYFNCETRFTRYMTKSSFGIYILHYPVLMSVCYSLYRYFNFPAICNYLIAIVFELLLTFILYEIIKRIPIICVLVLGSTKKSSDGD